MTKTRVMTYVAHVVLLWDGAVVRTPVLHRQGHPDLPAQLLLPVSSTPGLDSVSAWSPIVSHNRLAFSLHGAEEAWALSAVPGRQ